MGVLATAVAMDTERGLLMPSPLLLLRLSLRLMLKLIMATEDTVVMEATVDTATAAMVDTDMERGQLMLMPSAMADTALAMEATAMAAMVDTDTARGPLMPMPTTAMVDTDTAMVVTALATAMDTATARGPLMPMPTTAMVDTATERGQLMPMPTMAMVVMADTDMAADMADMATESKLSKLTLVPDKCNKPNKSFIPKTEFAIMKPKSTVRVFEL